MNEYAIDYTPLTMAAISGVVYESREQMTECLTEKGLRKSEDSRLLHYI